MIVTTYCIYLTLTILITVWVAQTLFKHGRIFLVDVFHGNEGVADSVNHLLVVGFYLINLGYVSLMMKTTDPVPNAQAAIEELAGKLGLVLLVLGGMHFFNLFVFNKIRNTAVETSQRERYLVNYPPAGPTVQAPRP